VTADRRASSLPRPWIARSPGLPNKSTSRLMAIATIVECGQRIMPLLPTKPKNGALRLRELLSGPDLVVAPGAYDCLSARLVAAAGFPAVYMTGFGTAASYLGRPDVGLLGMSEMVDNARRIVDAVELPVIADADTGYGNPISVIRTVQAYERAGVAAIHIEDQLAPKKCGHMEGKQLISPVEMAAKVRAAVAARSSPDFAIIARTDARAVEGLELTLERARRYRATSRPSPRRCAVSRCCSIGPRVARPRRCRCRASASSGFGS
jgi:isocitrate lyase